MCTQFDLDIDPSNETEPLARSVVSNLPESGDVWRRAKQSENATATRKGNQLRHWQSYDPGPAPRFLHGVAGPSA